VPVKANQARVKTRWMLILRHYKDPSSALVSTIRIVYIILGHKRAKADRPMKGLNTRRRSITNLSLTQPQHLNKTKSR